MKKTAIVTGLILIGVLTIKAQFSRFNQKWTPLSGYNDFCSVKLNANGSYSLIGRTQTTMTSGPSDALFMTYDYWGNATAYNGYGTTGTDKGYDFTKISTGGYMCTGSTDISGNEDILVLPIGSSVFTPRRIGGNQSDVGKAIKQTADGGFIIAGYTQSFGAGSTDGYLVKLDATGNVTWTKTYGSTTGEVFEDVIQTSDGGYLVSGGKSAGCLGFGGDLLLVKFDANGNVIWSKCIAAPYQQYVSIGEFGFSVIQTTDGNYVTCGHIMTSGGDTYFFLVKVNTLGNLIFAKTYDIPGGYNDIATSIKQTSDQGFIIAGKCGNTSAGVGMKTDGSGNVTWAKFYYTNGNDWLLDVEQHGDGGYIFCGYSTVGTVTSAFLVKTDASGASWCNETNITPVVTSIDPTITPLVYIPGTGGTLSTITTSTTLCSTSDVYVNCIACPVDAGRDKTNAYKKCCLIECSSVQIGVSPVTGYTYSWTPCNTTLSSCTSSNPYASPCSSTVYTLTVSGNGCLANTDMVTVTTLTGLPCDCGGSGRIVCPKDHFSPSLDVFPNPSSGKFKVMTNGINCEHLVITDINGKTVFEKKEFEISEFEIDISTSPKGIYFVKAVIDSKQYVQKIFIE